MTVAETPSLPSLEELERDLEKNYYCSIPFPLKRQDIEEAFKCYLNFLELPDDVKNFIDYRVCKTHRRDDVGYKKREPTDGLYRDSKEFFHFHPSIFELYPAFIDQHPVLKKFLVEAEKIYSHLENAVKEI